MKYILTKSTIIAEYPFPLKQTRQPWTYTMFWRLVQPLLQASARRLLAGSGLMHTRSDISESFQFHSLGGK
jgi:hypothetical protein